MSEYRLYSHHQIELTVKDDGKGFDAAKVKSWLISLSGNGLQNMQMRAKEMKGSAYIDSEMDKGTTVIFVIPYPLVWGLVIGIN